MNSALSCMLLQRDKIRAVLTERMSNGSAGYFCFAVLGFLSSTSIRATISEGRTCSTSANLMSDRMVGLRMPRSTRLI